MGCSIHADEVQMFVQNKNKVCGYKTLSAGYIAKYISVDTQPYILKNQVIRGLFRNDRVIEYSITNKGLS